MIECLHQGNMPAITGATSSLPHCRYVTLTEVACCTIYGAALTPGRGTLRQHLAVLIRECHELWSDPNGPIWLKPHLELIAAGREWSFEPGCSADSREITLGWFAKSRKWLEDLRKRPAGDGATESVRQRKSRLAALDDQQAIEMALLEATRLEVAEGASNDKTARFYKQLSQEVMTGSVVLKGIPLRVSDGAYAPREIGAPLHTSRKTISSSRRSTTSMPTS